MPNQDRTFLSGAAAGKWAEAPNRPALIWRDDQGDWERYAFPVWRSVAKASA